nr:ribonuclease H-like domain-containing protein [Tanacetum cinerariifolium]
MLTKIELALEQSQQGVSNDVLARKIYYWDLTSGIKAYGELLKRRIYRSNLKPSLTNFNLISLSKISDHEDETIPEENAHPKVVPQITTVTNISDKFPYLKKGDAKSMATDNDGNLKIRPPVTTEEHQQSGIALILKTKGGLEYISFDDLYNKLKFLEIDTKGYSSSSLTLFNAAFVSTAGSSQGNLSYQESGNGGYTTSPGSSSSKGSSKSKCSVVDDYRLDKQTEEGNTEPRSLENFGMIVGIKIESDADLEGEVVSADDAIPAGVSAGTVATDVVNPQSETEFAFMGLSTADNSLRLEKEKDRGIVDSGCSRRKISGKGTIKTKTLNFENVLYVEELQHFNLISVSQICDQSHRILFTENECLVLSKDFPLPDPSMVILSILRKHNLYPFSLNELAPKGPLTCLIAKASQTESTLWHRRLGHVNFKNMNKL